MLLTVYNLRFELIAQFDDYNSLANYLDIKSIDCIQSYLSKSKKDENKTIKNKDTNEFVYIRRDTIGDDKY